jgi:hypothetical protein
MCFQLSGFVGFSWVLLWVSVGGKQQLMDFDTIFSSQLCHCLVLGFSENFINVLSCT